MNKLEGANLALAKASNGNPVISTETMQYVAKRPSLQKIVNGGDRKTILKYRNI